MKNDKYKIIFLDFDGVITTLESGWYICPKKMDLLGKIIEKTDAKIVVSSSWRRDTIEDTLKFITGGSLHAKKHPFKFADRVIGVTERLQCFSLNDKTDEITGRKPVYGIPRGVEIDKWLMEHDKEVKSYVILDDDSDMLLWHKDNFIKTHPFKGLSQEDVEQAIKILNQDENNN